ncbi:MAG: M20/M25/M40 family metallo-hydrolase [Actinobacteria bacterium]|nr:M20/M25/M40 family metallo-hydrolase [Actinomycetota bacterium]
MMHEHFNCRKAFLHIRKLSSSGRLYGSHGERLARVYIKAVGEEMAVPFREEKFYFNNRARTAVAPVFCLGISALCAAGAVSFLLNGHAMLVFGPLILLVAGLPVFGQELFGKLGVFKGNDTAFNLEGTLAGGRRAGTIIICAHYDSKSQRIPPPARMVMLMFGLASAAAVGVALAVLGLLLISGAELTGKTGYFFIMLVPACVFAALAMDRNGNGSPGALDNASGVAIVLELSRIFKARPLENFDLRAVFFGAEESGLCGSLNYLKGHSRELAAKPCFVLNFDMPFSQQGMLSVNTRFGFPSVPTSSRLNGIVREAAGEMGYKMRNMNMPGGVSDHCPWVREGFNATAFTSSANYIHGPGDTAGRINTEALRRSGEVALDVVLRLDKEHSDPA